MDVPPHMKTLKNLGRIMHDNLLSRGSSVKGTSYWLHFSVAQAQTQIQTQIA